MTMKRKVMRRSFTKQKRNLLLQFYSVKNFGDDMFVRIFAEEFSEYQIRLLCNPLHVPKTLPSNVCVAKAGSWIISLNKKIMKVFENKAVLKMMRGCNQFIIKLLRKKADASVIITGSLYMDFPIGLEKEKNFYIDESVRRTYEITSTFQNNGGDFIIGANIGPIYHDGFIEKVEKELLELNHICLRDYASYLLLKDKRYVQYAPDVLFCINPKTVRINETYQNKVLISVISMEYQHITDEQKEIYFQFIADIIQRIGLERCCLVAFCKKEGDDRAVAEILAKFCEKERSKIMRLSYSDNMDEILEAFKSCRFVVSTRFHSMILAAVFGKRMYPISYNCKIENYLSDLNFKGKYVVLDKIEQAKVEDVLQNQKISELYENIKHVQYAKNQFYVLKQYLNTVNEVHLDNFL